MSTATLKQDIVDGQTAPTASIVPLLLGWTLMLPFLFFATHGAFSFQSRVDALGGSFSGYAQVRDRGFLGYVIIPGVAYSIVVWLIKGKLSHVVATTAHFKMLTFLALLTVCSAAWSQNPTRSALYGFFYLVDTLFAYYLVIRFSPEEMMALVSRAGIVVCLLGLIMVVFFPQFGVIHDDLRASGAWNGIFIDRTSAAKCLVFLLSPALVSKGKYLGGRILYILLLTVMIIQTRAVTAIFVLSICLIFAVSLQISHKLGPKLSLMIFTLASITMTFVTIVGYDYVPVVLQAFGRDSTLSGRTVIWGILMGPILKRPLLGYGYYAFWQGLTGASANVIHATHWVLGYAHNGILEVALQLGLLGVIVFFSTLLWAIKNAWFCFRNDPSGRYDWYIVLIVLTILYNIDEATVVWPNELLSILYVIACCGLAQGAAQLKQDRHIKEQYI